MTWRVSNSQLGDEGTDSVQNHWRRLVLVALVVAALLTACGSAATSSSTGGAPAPQNITVPPAATRATMPAVVQVQCPSTATVNAALGVTLPSATVILNVGGQLPSGASGIGCEYHGQTSNVVIEMIHNVSASYITQFSTHFPQTFTSVSGVGDQARSFSQTLSGGKNNRGVVATKGSTLVAVIATATPASLAQVEAFVTQLL